MFAHLVLVAVLLFAGKDPQVVGTWGMGGATILWINADGTGELEGEPFKWSTDKGVLTIVSEDGETEKVSYSVKSGRLALAMDGVPMTFDRMGGAAATPEPTPKGVFGKKAAAQKGGKTAEVPEGMEGLSPEEIAMLQQLMGAQGAGTPAAAAPPKGAGKGAPQAAGKDSLSQLLLSSAWCSFSYNKTSGYSNTERFQFFANGTFSVGARGEGYSSGYGGTMASQHDSGNGGNWKVVNGQLHLSTAETGGQFVPVPVNVTQNSNGAPILHSNGKEYSRCQ